MKTETTVHEGKEMTKEQAARKKAGATRRGTKYARGINRSLKTIKASVRRHKRKVQELQQAEPRAKGCQQRLEHAKAKLRQEEELLEQKLAQPSEEPPKKK